MLHPIRQLSTAALSVAALITTASAEERGYAAALCNPNTTTDAGRIMYTVLGVETTGLSSANVSCGAAPLVAADVTRIQATVYDRNPAADLCCNMMVKNTEGFGITSATRCSAGSGNPAQVLTFIPPANVVGTVELACTIPAAAPTGASRIATYRVRSTP